ncbi:MAG: ATP-binding protein [Rubrobacteraceae bacterium]
MEATKITDCLREVPLFQSLDEEKLRWVSEQGEVLDLESGATIATQGDPPDGFYMILEGETEWTQNVGGEEVYVVTLGAGDIFAELILVLDEPYPTTGRATTDLRLYKISPDAFWNMLTVCPEVLRSVVSTSAERAQLHETVSQQQAKLASLGTLAAGLAHELNNPAAAISRSAQEAREVFRSSSARAIELNGLEMTPEEREFVAGLPEAAARRAEEAPQLDSLDQSDREDEVAIWLEDRDVEEAWDLSPTLVAAGLDEAWLGGLAEHISDEKNIPGVLNWLVAEMNGDELLREIEDGSARISELVKAIKSYSHMDKAPLQQVDIHEGLESTLTMLGHKLKKGDVRVERDYAGELPRVCAHGSELNQVWTNLLDNAIDAVAGEGRIEVRTGRENGRILVEISDSGPGIPEEAQGKIFEPFFTTKDVGKGTGLGLDIVRRIVSEKHKGSIRFDTGPDGTTFQVRLPVNPNEEDGS